MQSNFNPFEFGLAGLVILCVLISLVIINKSLPKIFELWDDSNKTIKDMKEANQQITKTLNSINQAGELRTLAITQLIDVIKNQASEINKIENNSHIAFQEASIKIDSVAKMLINENQKTRDEVGLVLQGISTDLKAFNQNISGSISGITDKLDVVLKAIKVQNEQANKIQE